MSSPTVLATNTDAPAHAQERWASHERRCAVARRGGWCPRCVELLRAADAEDGKRWGWPE